jgi:hypothetical protein
MLHAMPIFYTLIHRLPSLQPRMTESETRVGTFPKSPTELTEGEAEFTEQYLNFIGRELKWTLADGHTGGIADAGSCTIRPEAPLLKNGLLGYGSTIATSPSSVAELNRAVQAGDDDQAEYLSFQLASLWMHELAHAVVFAVLPDGGRGQVFLGPNAKTSEVGFEMEASLFGGHLSVLRDEASIAILRTSLSAKQWPDWTTVKSYGGSDKDNVILTRADQEEINRRWDVVWRVEWSWITRLFDESFWSVGTPMSRATELRPLRRFGLLRDLTGSHMTEAERDAVTLTLYQEGFALGDDGLVVEWRGRNGARL